MRKVMLNMDRIESTQLTTSLGLRMHITEIATMTCFLKCSSWLTPVISLLKITL